MPARPSLPRFFLRWFVHRILAAAISGVGGAARLRASRQDVVPRRVDSILVVRIDLLGDVLFTRPILEGLRAAYPFAHLTFVTLPFTAPLARSFGVADTVIPFDSNAVRSPRAVLTPAMWRRLIRSILAIRATQPDLAVSVTGRTASLVAFLSGARRVIGYQSEAYLAMLTDAERGGRYGTRMHEVEYGRRLARRAGAPNPPRRLIVAPAEVDTRAVSELLVSVGVRPEDRVVVVHAGSTNGAAKRWLPDRWAAFADAVTARTGARVFLAGAASDLPLAEEVMRHARQPLVSLVGETSVPELIALLARADLVASGDSGPLHLAVALARPLVAVYGPTDLWVHGPYRPAARVRVHRADLPCSPCYTLARTAECPLGSPVCMRLVTVEQMVESAVELLGGAR